MDFEYKSLSDFIHADYKSKGIEMNNEYNVDNDESNDFHYIEDADSEPCSVALCSLLSI